jgi:mono/diheme cytochrome c family protein
LTEQPGISKSSKILFKKRLLMFTVCAVTFSGGAALAERQKYSGVVKYTAPSITGLHSDKELPGPTTPVPDLDENMNQCAGTVQHYRLPATGYTPPPPSNDSRAGKLLYVKRNCGSCHQAENKGGTLGPPLDGIGGARGEQFITAHLLDPEKQMLEFPDLFGGRSNIMPHLGIRLNEAKLITAYLLTLPEPQNGFLVSAHPKIGAPSKEHSEVKIVAKPATAKWCYC